MKILPVEKIREADAYTIQHEPIADIDLMERAAGKCVEWIKGHVQKERKVLVVCGAGNNGGDGYAIARMLLVDGFHTDVLVTGKEGALSASCQINYTRLRNLEGDYPALHIFDTISDIQIDGYDVVIDALFGSGLARPILGELAGLISELNKTKGVVIAIDVPSGLFCDATTGRGPSTAVIQADYTLTFVPPKLAFFFPENDKYVGDLHLLDIGISKEFMDGVACHNFMMTHEDCMAILKKRSKYAHKGNFGHALLVCGSEGKMGAAVLSAKACLRAGAGLVTAQVPACGVPILQTALPEAMALGDTHKSCISEISQLDVFSVIGAGPGLGQAPETEKALKLMIQNASGPMVLDADALNILAANPTWLAFLPKGSIFTPHPKEFERLAGKASDDFDRNQKQRDFSIKYSIYVILKGAHTAITTPEGNCYFNTTGNPGMATAGSGDVLTGIITGIKAQGYSSLEASVLGIYLHGLAGDLAMESKGEEALIASDIIENLGNAYKTLYG
jgi:hydroxyethylthiazole kinase-like uncharacterized protein yjeF